MSKYVTVEDKLYKGINTHLDELTSSIKEDDRFEARLLYLECVSSIFGGFDIQEFHNIFGIDSILSYETLLDGSCELVNLIKNIQVPTALVLSSLATQPLQAHERKLSGAYYTDHRLALHIAEEGDKRWDKLRPIIDPACGTGILLVAITYINCGDDKNKSAEFMKDYIVAADMSHNALRGALLSLASLTNDLNALLAMRKNWVCGDSLFYDKWNEVATEGFGLVIANPPWEKVKTIKHEYLNSIGDVGHYGREISNIDEESYQRMRLKTKAYAEKLATLYPEADSGEMDLYMAFTALILRLISSNGIASILIPGGVIRSEGTLNLRRKVLESSDFISFTVFDNKPKYFAIDSRVKFVNMVVHGGGGDKTEEIILKHAKSLDGRVSTDFGVVFDYEVLKQYRPDLSLPELRSQEEYNVFKKMYENGEEWQDKWNAKFYREVDMTRDKGLFKPFDKSRIPLVEGRMVHQFRLGAKAYRSGTGRKAVWETIPIGESSIQPQFSILPDELPSKLQERVRVARAGFCDIAGQTNERAMMATLIPSGVVCGNKVPTVSFFGDDASEKTLLWLGVVNSFAFDWLLRRVLTTTVNYFLLRSVPLAPIEIDSEVGIRMLNFVKRLIELDNCGSSYQNAMEIAEIRVNIDALCFAAYQLSLSEVEVILGDFPLLDRSQPCIKGEARSTVTKDFVMSRLYQFNGISDQNSIEYSSRLKEALACGAIPYVPSQSFVS
ncbi:N-6 DNA methylase [Vibrio parahaemolyticus]|uniref:N-6 DNA methylase n=1 Tax=Vibrio parahaemolyticus TaxID=670 RepID=UPI0009AA97E5|nr:N-6 DNA methylase [Vibrio parahaemolyticus]EGQ8312542.1 N-6 DNA methylase [Vibrio parahaemolyticus]EGQ8852890.1 N-6 DNA methylase [Vibrio parahaemolyticus]EGQ8857539.1 N-6 DNA methylase [Vibrio parahaemolyticus]EGQ8877026.1 N-6 DNA methylase [Vibrio parahaemolyticus]EGQ8996225.1 N-6 DNA methylase [Vibrio parahaemolyticus]